MENVHERVLHLRDVALGSNRTVKVNSDLAPASYDCALDSLLALYTECNQASNLNKDKNVGRFLTKYEGAVRALKELRLTAGDFEVKGIIGRGHFGEVQVVAEKSTGDVFAMKVMRKAHILQQADAAFFNEERDIMAWATSPWLTSLHYAFQDASCLYLVMDYHPGGDLLTVMERREGGMSEEETRFYLSEIVAGLHDLHQLGFVHRDVKPENVLISRTGHIKLVDFGSAARLGTDGKVLESRLPVGTPEYIAPEVLTSLDKTADYGVGCDWWSLGIIAYELIHESTPFEDESTSKTYANIMGYKAGLSFPNDVTTSSDVKDLIQKLLTDPAHRLSCDGIRNHAFFQSTRWDDLLSCAPPHIPVVASSDDMSNFDTFEPEKENNLRFPDLPSKNQKTFSGKSLPFVGFTFTRYSTNFDQCTRADVGASGESSVDQGVAKDLRSSLERVEKELEDTKERKSSLERECVIYQTQLDDFHRKLEIEKTERHQSDCRALQLLEEVRELGRMAKQLRESEATTTEKEMSVVIEQLEQDRAMASKRARRMKEELKQAQAERDVAIKAAVELKSKLTAVKETSRKEITALQTKVAKVTKDSLSKSSEMQDRLTEAFECHQELMKKLQTSEEEKKKMKYELQNVQMQLTESSSVGVKSEGLIQELQGKVATLQRETEASMKQCNQFRMKIKEVESQLDEINSVRAKLQDSEVNLKKELHDARSELTQVRDSRDQLRNDRERIEEELALKNEQIKTQEEAIGKHSATKQFLETKVAELEKVRESTDKEVNDNFKAQLEKMAELEREKQQMKDHAYSLEAQLVLKGRAVKGAEGRIEEAELKHKENTDRLRDEIHSLQTKLSEVSSTAIEQGERLREVRRAKRELDSDNNDLKTALKNAQKKVDEADKKYQTSLTELEGMTALKSKLSDIEKRCEVLEAGKEKVVEELERARNTNRELKEERRKLELDLRSTRKQFEAQELKAAMLKRSAELLEEELGEAKTATEEAKAREEKWKSAKDVVAGDLETAESRLDDAYTTCEKEKNLRLAADHRLSEAMSNLEKATVAHSEKVSELQESLTTQKQLASKYNDRISELEKELRLKLLSLKDVKKQLDTERIVSSKVYDEAHSLRLELGKVKAAHMKLVREVQEREAQLAKSEADRNKVLMEQRSIDQARYVQETRLQATIAQQSKLIDYLQQVGTISPRSGGLDKIKKGLKLGRRKGHDPARDIAEWNKLKGIARSKSGKVHSSSTTGLSSLLNASQVSNSSAGSASSSTHPQLEGVVTSTPMPGASKTLHCQDDEPDISTLSMSDKSCNKKMYMYVSKQALGAPIITPLLPRLYDHHKTPSQKGAADDRATEPPMSTTPSLKITTTPHVSNHTPKTEERKVGSAAGKRKLPTDSQHTFNLKSAGIRKKYTCGVCSEAIKATQKLIKCSGCQVMCHPSCVDQLPDACSTATTISLDMPPLTKRSKKNQKTPSVPKKASKEHESTKKNNESQDTPCLPKSLPDAGKEVESTAHVQQPGTRKRQKSPETDDKSPQERGQNSPMKSDRDTERRETRDSVCRGLSNKDADMSENMPPLAKRRRGGSNCHGDSDNVDIEKLKCGDSKVIKTGHLGCIWRNTKYAGWLILTESSLKWYELKATHTSGKPMHTFDFKSSGCTFDLFQFVDERSIPADMINPRPHRMFAVKKHEADSLDEVIFIASNVESKVEWLEEIGQVLRSHSGTTKMKSTVTVKKIKTSNLSSPTPKGNLKELKAVSIVPVRTDLKKSSTDLDSSHSPAFALPGRRSRASVSMDNQDMDLSIRSSMFGSPSDTSFI